MLSNGGIYSSSKNKRYNLPTFRRLHDAIIKGTNDNKKLINASSRVTTDLHSGGGYTNTLARIESVCTFKLGVFVSRKIGQDLKECETKPQLVNQQYVVYQFKCNLCDTGSYVGYTRRHLYARVDGHKSTSSSVYLR